MSASQRELLRQLRVAFTAQELAFLQGDETFDRACRECSGAPDCVKELIKLGGARLAEKQRAKWKLGNRK